MSSGIGNISSTWMRWILSSRSLISIGTWSPINSISFPSAGSATNRRNSSTASELEKKSVIKILFVKQTLYRKQYRVAAASRRQSFPGWRVVLRLVHQERLDPSRGALLELHFDCLRPLELLWLQEYFEEHPHLRVLHVVPPPPHRRLRRQLVERMHQ